MGWPKERPQVQEARIRFLRAHASPDHRCVVANRRSTQPGDTVWTPLKGTHSLRSLVWTPALLGQPILGLQWPDPRTSLRRETPLSVPCQPMGGPAPLSFPVHLCTPSSTHFPVLLQEPFAWDPTIYALGLPPNHPGPQLASAPSLWVPAFLLPSPPSSAPLSASAPQPACPQLSAPAAPTHPRE